MLKLNSILKFFGYVYIYLITILQYYAISLLITGSVFTITCSIISMCTELPNVLVEKYWLMYLLSSIPITVVIFIAVMKRANKPINKK